MHFSLIDRVVEWSPSPEVGGSGGAIAGVGGRLVAIKLVSSAEEYLQDHFASFPVLPGVLMLEAFVQAARELLEREAGGIEKGAGTRMVLGRVRALKYGNFVPPGSTLRVDVEKVKVSEGAGGEVEFKGVGMVIHPGTRANAAAAEGDSPVEATAVSGRFVLRPVRLGDKA